MFRSTKHTCTALAITLGLLSVSCGGSDSDSIGTQTTAPEEAPLPEPTASSEAPPAETDAAGPGPEEADPVPRDADGNIIPPDITPTRAADGRFLINVVASFADGPAGAEAADMDGDGDIDLTVSGDGDDRIFWFEQTSPGQFAQHVLAESFAQAAGGTVADLDGDGDNEVVFTSYETHEVLIFSLS